MNLTNKLIRKCRKLTKEQRDQYIELGRVCQECEKPDFSFSSVPTPAPPTVQAPVPAPTPAPPTAPAEKKPRKTYVKKADKAKKAD
jgi:hypothetical protein